MSPSDLNILAGWLGILGGVLAGAYVGLFFHRDDWAGGYDSFRKRALRLGHISFFGLGIVNILHGVTVKTLGLSVPSPGLASGSLVLGAVTMPLCCYLAAWKKPFRHLFPIPVACVAVGVVLTLAGWASR